MGTISLRKNCVLLLFALVVSGLTSPGYAQQGQPAMLQLHLEIGPLAMLRMPSWVALSEGIYKKNGLDVDQCHTAVTRDELVALGIKPPTDMYVCRPKTSVTSYTPTTTTAAGAMPAFLGNSLSDPIVMGGGFPSVMGQVINPQAEKRLIILSTSNVTGWPIYTRKGITTPEQLKGGRIGVLSFTDIHGFQAMAFAEAMGWDPRFDMTLVLEWGPQAFKDLESGKLDAIVAVDSAQILAIKAGYKPLVDLGQWKIPMTSASINANVEWLKNNQEIARRLVKSQIEARALMEKDRSVFNRALVKYFNITDPKMQDIIYSQLDTLPRKPYPAAEGIRKAMKLYDSFYPQLRQHRAEEFVDESFVRELDDSGYIDSLYK